MESALVRLDIEHPAAQGDDTTVEHGRHNTPPLLISSPQTKFSESQSQRNHVDTARGNLAKNPTSTSILGSDFNTKTLQNTPRDTRAQEATSSPLQQSFKSTGVQTPQDKGEYQEQKDRAFHRIYQVKEPKTQSLKDVMTKALRKAHHAVTLDQHLNYEGALNAYEETCSLLRRVMRSPEGVEDRLKLDAVVSELVCRVTLESTLIL